MLIKESQISALGSQPKEEFILKTIVFLKKEVADWTSSRQDQDIRDSIQEMIDIGKENDIRKEINIQKLLYYSIAYKLELPFSAILQDTLETPNIGEDLKTKKLIKASFNSAKGNGLINLLLF